MTGNVVAIITALEAEVPVQSVEKAQLEAGRGIVGDRYFSGKGTFSEKLQEKRNSDWEVTLVETEEIDKFNEVTGCNFNYGDFRRNISTRGVKLNSLVGRQFSINDVLLEGLRLCEPCAHLARLTDERVLPLLVGHGGLRARILGSGTISVGDQVDVPDA